jgi:hypothetical protein
MNTAVFRFINDTLRHPFLDVVVPVFSERNYAIISGLMMAVLLLWFRLQTVDTREGGT